MRLGLYSVLDRKLREFGQLVLERNDEAVLRSLHAGLRQQPDSMMAKYPDDFDLYQVGEFETETGRLVVHDPRIVASVKEIAETGKVDDGR